MVKLKILLISLILAVSSCDEYQEDYKIYDFVGDSIIARWPVSETLPSQLVYNYGKSGARIEYIKDLKGRFNNKNVVVIIGTNDNYFFKEEYLKDYAKDYLESIYGLTDSFIYLFSVLPREFKTDSDDINEWISRFNAEVKSRLNNYPNIRYIDVYNDFMKGAHINYQYYSDGLHINGYGYELLSQKLLEYICK